MQEKNLQQFAKNLGYHFKNDILFQAAITHRSIGGTNNERLEFLGDSILNFTIASLLYNRFTKAREGELTRMRAMLVKEETLAEVARDLQVGKYLHLGLGELKSGGHQRGSILADALEAIIGAIYLDSDIHTCRERILAWYGARLENIIPDESQKDAKTRLQEFLQARHLPLPEYQVVSVEGDPHDPIFHVQCNISGLDKPLVGVANSRRKAEQIAAETALKVLHV